MLLVRLLFDLPIPFYLVASVGIRKGLASLEVPPVVRLDGEDKTRGDGEPIILDEFNTAIKGLRRMILNLGNQARLDEDRGEDQCNKWRPLRHPCREDSDAKSEEEISNDHA
ncbi:unnamed protein product [Prunus armeniaca]